MHDKGNEENIFDRFDYVFSPKNALHLNFQFTRSWFQTPNSYDNLNIRRRRAEWRSGWADRSAFQNPHASTSRPLGRTRSVQMPS